MEKIEAGIGFCLLFTLEEYKELEILLSDYGYPPTKQGLKDFILDGGSGDDEEKTASSRLGDTLRDAIRNNPEVTEALAKDGINIARNLFKKKFKL